MPQLDFHILNSQGIILLILILGYFLFLRYLLPTTCYFLKLQNKLVLSKYIRISKSTTFLEDNKSFYEVNFKILTILNELFKFYRFNFKTKLIFYI